MANYGPDDVGFVLVGAYNLLADSAAIQLKIEQLTDESTSLGDSWTEHSLLGLFRADLSQNGYFNDAAAASNAALVGLGAARVFSVGVEGNTIGKQMIGLEGAVQLDYERIASLSALHRARSMLRVTGQVDHGLILHALTAETANMDTEGANSQDNGASSAAGGVGYLHVTAYSGFTNIIAKVRHSTDDVTYADLITFATVTATTSERKTVSGTVNRHTAMNLTVSGAGSATFMVGFKRG